MIVGNEGEGVSRLVREACDFTASIPMKGDIDSLNASVAAGVLAVSYTHLDVYKRQLPKNVLCEVEMIAAVEK